MSNSEGDDDCISTPIRQLLESKASKDLVEAKFVALEQRIAYESETRQRAIDKAEESTKLALQKAETDSTMKFANTNEWRASFKDREAAFVTRTEHKGMEDKIHLCITRADHEALIAQFESKTEKVQLALENQIRAMDERRYITWGGILLTLCVAGFALLGIKI
jgi:hypothetical protein